MPRIKGENCNNLLFPLIKKDNWKVKIKHKYQICLPYIGKKQAVPPGGHIFGRINKIWVILEEGPQRINCAILFSNLTSSFW